MLAETQMAASINYSDPETYADYVASEYRVEWDMIAPLISICVELAAILAFVYLARRWYRANPEVSSPILEACIGARESSPDENKRPPVEGSPLLGAGSEQQYRVTGDMYDVRDMLICAVGVLGTGIPYSLFQEEVMTRVWKAQGESFNYERFTHANFLTFANRIVLVLLALSYAGLRRFSLIPSTSVADTAASRWEYSLVAGTNLLSSTAQSASLHFISFPVLVLAKSLKMPLVTLFNALLYRRTPRLSHRLSHCLPRGLHTAWYQP